MSTQESNKPKVVTVSQKYGRLVILSVFLLALLIILWLFFFHKKPTFESVYAAMDGMVYTLSPEISAKVVDIVVREGSFVKKGQIVGHLDVSEYNRSLVEAQKEVARLRPPSMEEIASRLKESEKAEVEAGQRLARARHEEEAKQKYVEQCVLEHVQAELRLRALPQSPNDPTYQRARAHELKLREKMNRAKEDFEITSRKRAALGQELQRVRREIQEAKRIASNTRYTAVLRNATQNIQNAQKLSAVDGNILSPLDGTVIAISARAGDFVKKSDPVLLILPESQDRENLWVNAWFNVDDGKVLKRGLWCRVTKLDGGASYEGTIDSIAAPSRLPQKNAEALFLPIKIRLQSTAGLRPGDLMSCSVRLE